MLTIKAVVRNGVLVPHEHLDLPNDAEVELTVQGPFIIPPEIADREERAKLLRAVTERMRQNPIPATAPHYTRDELNERR
jgi:hypothetical protein